MSEYIKNAFVFSSGVMVGISVCGLIITKKAVSSKYFKPVIRGIVTDKIDRFLFGEDSHKNSSISYPNVYHVGNPVLSSRAEAESVFAKMDDIIQEYGILRLSDVYDLIGSSGDYNSSLYGWDDISDFFIQRVRLGYEIVVSEPKRIS